MALSMIHSGAGSKPATVIDVLHFVHWYTRATHTDAQVLGSRSMTAKERSDLPEILAALGLDGVCLPFGGT
jgi:hypothetical protein